MFQTVAPTDISAPSTNIKVSAVPMTEPENTEGDTPRKEQKFEDLKNQCSELISELDTQPNPKAVVKKHISQLSKYNELKDIALGLVTMIADQRQLRTTDILEEMQHEIQDEDK